jgi:membrane protein YdbS with pleckstrin-like domain
MKNNNVNVSSSSSSGIGFVGLLTIVFIVLKLLGKITWSWWWVLSPLWISVGLGIVVLLGIFIWAIIYVYIRRKR